jgi:hypothetical protein
MACSTASGPREAADGIVTVRNTIARLMPVLVLGRRTTEGSNWRPHGGKNFPFFDDDISDTKR